MMSVSVKSVGNEGVELDNGITISHQEAARLGLTEMPMKKMVEAAPVDKLEEYRRGIGKKEYPALAEAFRRNIELGMALLEDRNNKPVFSEAVRTEAEALIKENLAKLRAMTT